MVVNDAVEELDGEPGGIGRGDQSPNPTLLALGYRAPDDVEAGRFELGGARLERGGVGQFPAGERQALGRLDGACHHTERPFVDLDRELALVGAHQGSDELRVLPPGVDVGDADPDVAQPSNVHMTPLCSADSRRCSERFRPR